jgi:hypothetical protein
MCDSISVVWIFKLHPLRKFNVHNASDGDGVSRGFILTAINAELGRDFLLNQ